MCPNRKLSSIQCIFGDGFIDDSIKIDTDLQAIILADSFHLFIASNSVWSIEFGDNFGHIQTYLKIMLYAINEKEFDKAYNAAYHQLRGNTDHMQYLKKIGFSRDRFSKYLLDKVAGSMSRHGSSHAEQNHASILSRIGKRCVPIKIYGIKNIHEWIKSSVMWIYSCHCDRVKNLNSYLSI